MGNFRITVEGDSADCACYVQASHAGKDVNEQKTYEVWAEYRDKLERRESGWKIVERYMHVIKELGTRDVLRARNNLTPSSPTNSLESGSSKPK